MPLTFTDSKAVKEALGIDSALEVAAIAAFGYPQKARKHMRINILSMSNVDISAKRHYFEPKRSVSELVHKDTWGSRDGLDSAIGFYDDMLWESFYAAVFASFIPNSSVHGTNLPPLILSDAPKTATSSLPSAASAAS